MGQTTFTLNQAVAVAGMLADSGIDYVATKINDGVAQITTVTIVSEENTTLFTITINGVPCEFTTDASGTFAETQAGLLAAINDSAFNGEGLAFDVSAAAGTATTIVITADVEGVQFTTTVTATILTVALTTPHSGAIPFGVIVAQATDQDECRLPVVTGDIMLGASVIDQTEVNQIRTGINEYQIGSTVGIMRQGRIWMVVEDAVTAGAPVYVRFAVSANGIQLGAVRSDADSASAVLLAGAVFDKTQATPGGLVIVNLNRP